MPQLGDTGPAPDPLNPPISQDSTTVELFVRASERVDVLSRGLVEQLESRSPGHPFGWKKYQHMLTVADRIEGLARQLGWPEVDLSMARLVGLAHDVGRVEEQRLRLDTLRPTERHGMLSRNLLREACSLEELPNDVQDDILNAIAFHSEREVPLPDGCARALCYLLRDIDKIEILADSKYLAPDGVLEQLKLHYLSEDEKVLLERDENLRERLNKLIRASLVDGSVAPSEQSSSAAPEDALLRRVWAIMNTGVVSHVLSYVEKGETIPIDEIGYSYATYMLFSLAMIFDIENEVARLTVQHDHLLDTRLSFLHPRLNEQDFEHLKTLLARA